MAIFYTDSGSLRDLTVSGSTVMSASRGIALQVKSSGSTIFSVSGSGGEIFNISDIGSSTSLFTVASGSTTILNIDNTKNVSISGSLVVTGSTSISGSLTLNIPGKAANYVLKSDANGGATWDSINNLVGYLIATGSVTASVNVGTASFQVTSGSSTFILITSASNVGIGTTTPSYKLDVNGIANANGIQVGQTGLLGGNSRRIINSGGTLEHQSNDSTTQHLFQNDVGNGFGSSANSTFVKMQAYGAGGSGSASTAILRLVGNNASESVTFLSNGAVGIASPNSAYRLHISGSHTSGSLNVDNVLYVSGSNVTITGSFAMSGSTLQFNIPSKATNYILKSDANGGATWDSIYNIIGNYIYSGSVTASVNVATASYFQVTSGSSQFFLVRDAINLGYNWSGYSWSTNNSLSIYSSAGAIRIGTSGNNSLSLTTNASDRWQVNTSGHFVAGSENAYDIGTSTTGKVRNIYVTGSIVTTGSVTINDVLVLPYQNPLPSGKPTGSIATSGSGATFIGLFIYTGAATNSGWVKISV